ncbi:hypothetical protein P280DRAFT_48847 [Massarina eburnea CBS 473.64]|uniref:Uncharacterized protein n=1 Tax=Massarina eburnea CBS 473.64 TaxID=1395130 RepID=A0A6A6RXA8_9PLEO|nr:hypothetical protein P280DRAFT_48847 [Massarina eburnea CBS 473.64]
MWRVATIFPLSTMTRRPGPPNFNRRSQTFRLAWVWGYDRMANLLVRLQLRSGRTLRIGLLCLLYDCLQLSSL